MEVILLWQSWRRRSGIGVRFVRVFFLSLFLLVRAVTGVPRTRSSHSARSLNNMSSKVFKHRDKACKACRMRLRSTALAL
ncbi:hypothetical protein J3E68DRAFT_406537 [Trichoderma sp. SZMC 28012]